MSRVDDPKQLGESSYEDAALKYLHSLPPEHFMEAQPQGTQRAITLASFGAVAADRPDVQCFNELLIQTRRPGGQHFIQVVPDNMALCHDKPIEAGGSFNLPSQPVGPLVVMEYVSKSSKRKDYEDNMRLYEQELRVPYYLLFYPETQDLQLFRHNGEKYVTVPPTEHGRHPIPELEMEVALLGGWVRYWFRGELVQLPADLVRGAAKLRAELHAAEELAQRERQRAEVERQRAEQEHQRAEQERQRAEQEKARAVKAEAEIERLLALVQQKQSGPGGV
jgi:Uma2 family endonuclease